MGNRTRTPDKRKNPVQPIAEESSAGVSDHAMHDLNEALARDDDDSPHPQKMQEKRKPSKHQE